MAYFRNVIVIWIVLIAVQSIAQYGNPTPSLDVNNILTFSNVTAGTYLSAPNGQSQVSNAWAVAPGSVLIGAWTNSPTEYGVSDMFLTNFPTIPNQSPVNINGFIYSQTNIPLIGMPITNGYSTFQISFPQTGQAASVGGLVWFPYYAGLGTLDSMFFYNVQGNFVGAQLHGYGEVTNGIEVELINETDGGGVPSPIFYNEPTNTLLRWTMNWNTNTASETLHVFTATNNQLIFSETSNNLATGYAPDAVLIGQNSPSSGVTSGALYYIGDITYASSNINSIGIANITALSPNEFDVSNAIAASDPGDTVIIPSGSAIWTNTLTITNSVNVVGSGIGQTVLYDNVSRSESVPSLFNFSPISTTTTNTFGYLSIIGTNTTQAVGGAVVFAGGIWRTTDCLFTNIYNYGVCYQQGAQGCIDHCVFDWTTVSSLVEIRGGNASTFYGDNNWAYPVFYGTSSNQVTMENDVFSYPSYPNPVIDEEFGGECTIRYCELTNVSFQIHGLDSSGRPRSGRSFEIYSNIFVNAADPGNGNAIGLRGGTGVMFSNTIVGYPSLCEFTVWRVTTPYGPWGSANGLNGWDTNGSVDLTGTTTSATGSSSMQDTTKSWTPNQWVGGLAGNANVSFVIQDTSQGGTNEWTYGIIYSNTANTIWTSQSHDLNSSSTVYINWTNGDGYAIYPVYHCPDQTGLGYPSDLIADESNNGIPSNTVTHALSSWPHESSEPFYQWGNINSDTNMAIGNNAGTALSFPIVILNRDYYDNTTKPGYTPAAYPDPLDMSVSNAPVVPIGSGGLPGFMFN
jgi:hypothetical protein